MGYLRGDGPHGLAVIIYGAGTGNMRRHNPGQHFVISDTQISVSVPSGSGTVDVTVQSGVNSHRSIEQQLPPIRSQPEHRRS